MKCDHFFLVKERIESDEKKIESLTQVERKVERCANPTQIELTSRHTFGTKSLKVFIFNDFYKMSPNSSLPYNNLDKVCVFVYLDQRVKPVYSGS